MKASAAGPAQQSAPANPKTAAGAKPERKLKEGTIAVILAETYLVIEQDKSTMVYDFRAKKILIRESTEQAWKSSSLYADLGFRIMEYQNRVMLGRALAAGGVKMTDRLGMGEPFDLETLFGFRFPNTQEDPPMDLSREISKDGASSFKHGGGEVVYFKPTQAEVPEVLRDAYVRWLVYRCRLHPEIRRQIVESAKVPETLRMHWSNTGTTGTTTLVLRSSSLMDGNAHEPKTESITGVDAEGPLLDLCRATQDTKRCAECPTLASAVKFADQAAASDHLLDGLLGLFEIMFQSGDNIIDEIKLLRPKIENDQQCKNYFAAMNQSNQEACKQSIELLRKFDRKGLTKDYVLDIHLADALSSLGQGAEAERIFMSVLQRNPFLAGVWNDLGQLYHHEYEMNKAWLCWDVARRIAPNHPMLADITRNELRMEHDFPEFFLSQKAAH
jgi:tetratricopeptide (TPR) repeat protein